MKKKFMVAGILATSLLLVGCGNQTEVLSCYMEDDSTAGMAMRQDVKMNFQNNSLETLDMTMTVTLDDTYVSMIDMLESTLKASLEEYDGKNGFTIDTSREDNKLVITLNGDITKLTEEEKESYDITSGAGTLEDAKTMLEGQGYTCE